MSTTTEDPVVTARLRAKHEQKIEAAATEVREGVNPLIAAHLLGFRIGRRVSTGDLQQLADALNDIENSEDRARLNDAWRLRDEALTRMMPVPAEMCD